MSKYVTLNNGVTMPTLGLGVWKVDDVIAEQVVTDAINNGYRAIDTAAAYGNETGVGRAIAKSSVNRDELFITTKIWNSDQGYESTLAAFDESRRKLNLDVVDLLLVHWPVKGKYVDTWRALEEIYSKGQVRAIGVSNFQTHHLDDIAAVSSITPAVNQVELHPLLSQEPLRAYCEQKNIRVTAWSPLMQGNLDQPVLAELAKKYNKSIAQLILRWDIQNGVIVIPKTTNPARMIENSQIYDFEISAEDMALISQLNKNQRFGSDPDNFNF